MSDRELEYLSSVALEVQLQPVAGRTLLGQRPDGGEQVALQACLCLAEFGVELGQELWHLGSGHHQVTIGIDPAQHRLADIHIRAMTSPEAGGERFLATGEFVWMREIAAALTTGLGADGARVPTRQLPDFLVRISAIFDTSLRPIVVSLGRRNRHTTDKAKRLLGWQSRPAAETVVDCARSLLAWKVV